MKVAVKYAVQLRSGDRFLNSAGEVETVQGSVDRLGDYVMFDSVKDGDVGSHVKIFPFAAPVEVLV